MNEAQDSIKKELDDPVEKKEEKEDKDEKGKA
jgi:hypothetical protein